MAEDNIDFEDMESGSHFSKEETNIRSIVLNHIKKICLLSCDEFTGGYFNSVTEFHGSLKYTKKVYVPDARAKYCQAIDTLYDLMIPFFDKPFKKALEDIEVMENKSPEQKIAKSRKMFKELNKLLHRVNYLGE